MLFLFCKCSMHWTWLHVADAVNQQTTHGPTMHHGYDSHGFRCSIQAVIEPAAYDQLNRCHLLVAIGYLHHNFHIYPITASSSDNLTRQLADGPKCMWVYSVQTNHTPCISVTPALAIHIKEQYNNTATTQQIWFIHRERSSIGVQLLFKMILQNRPSPILTLASLMLFSLMQNAIPALEALCQQSLSLSKHTPESQK